LKEHAKPLGVSSAEITAEKGVYVLIISVPSEKSIDVGRLGVRRFKDGYYAYTGSALGKGGLSLEGRINRHLRREKRKRWHIDFLLADEDVAVVSVLIIPTEEKIECEVNKYLYSAMNARVAVPNFGSSDCRQGCGSHLLYLGGCEKISERIIGLFREKMGDVISLRFV